jgi:hypothetical protein
MNARHFCVALGTGILGGLFGQVLGLTIFGGIALSLGLMITLRAFIPGERRP